MAAYTHIETSLMLRTHVQLLPMLDALWRKNKVVINLYICVYWLVGLKEVTTFAMHLRIRMLKFMSLFEFNLNSGLFQSDY